MFLYSGHKKTLLFCFLLNSVVPYTKGYYASLASANIKICFNSSDSNHNFLGSLNVIKDRTKNDIKILPLLSQKCLANFPIWHWFCRLNFINIMKIRVFVFVLSKRRWSRQVAPLFSYLNIRKCSIECIRQQSKNGVKLT